MIRKTCDDCAFKRNHEIDEPCFSCKNYVNWKDENLTETKPKITKSCKTCVYRTETTTGLNLSEPCYSCYGFGNWGQKSTGPCETCHFFESGITCPESCGTGNPLWTPRLPAFIKVRQFAKSENRFQYEKLIIDSLEIDRDSAEAYDNFVDAVLADAEKKIGKRRKENENYVVRRKYNYPDVVLRKMRKFF